MSSFDAMQAMQAMQNAQAYIMAVRGRFSIKPEASTPLSATQIWMKTTRQIAKDHRKEKAAAKVAEAKAKRDAKRKEAADALAARRAGRDMDKKKRARLATLVAHVHPEAELRAAETEAQHYREKTAAARAMNVKRKYPVLDPARLLAAKARARQFRRQSVKDRKSFEAVQGRKHAVFSTKDAREHINSFL